MSDTLNYIQYLQQPVLISEADREVFHRWVNEHPAVPIFRVLLAAKYQSENHPDTASYIEQAAFYVQDRKQLKNLLRNWQLQLENRVPAATEETKELISESAVTNVLEDVIQDEPVTADNTEENIIEEVSEDIALTEEDENELQEIIQSGLDEKSTEGIYEEKSEPNSSDLEFQPEELTIEPISESEEIDAQVQDTIEVPETTLLITGTENVEVKIVEDDGEADEITDPESEESITEADDIQFLKSIHKYEAAPAAPDHSYTDWELSTPVSHIPEISENEIIDTGLVSTDISWLTPWLEEFSIPGISVQKPSQPTKEKSIETTTPAKTETTTVQKQEIKTIAAIEVNAEPQVTEQKKQNTTNHSFDEWLSILEQKKQNSEEAPVFELPSPEVFDKKEIQEAEEKQYTKNDIAAAEKEFQPTDGDQSVKKMAADSVSFKQDMATETLAKLYIRQGKIDLAISIYQKLIEKFPEKSSYFAGQINRLK